MDPFRKVANVIPLNEIMMVGLDEIPPYWIYEGLLYERGYKESKVTSFTACEWLRKNTLASEPIPSVLQESTKKQSRGIFFFMSYNLIYCMKYKIFLLVIQI